MARGDGSLEVREDRWRTARGSGGIDGIHGTNGDVDERIEAEGREFPASGFECSSR